MPQVAVNYLAVVVAAIIYLVVGFLWYGPLFGRRWMALMNITPSSMAGGAIAKSTFLYERRPFALWVLNTGYHLVALGLMGALLAVWT